MGLIESMQDALPQGYANAILWLAFVLLLVVAVLGLIRLIRGFSGGTFVAGGRNRRTRLAVMDAAAVDSRRRLVLVRRDDVEHLVLIGGPTDVVIERDIRIASRPIRHGEPHDEALGPPAHSSPELERARAQIRPSPPPLRAAEPPRHAEPPRPAEPPLPARPAAAGTAPLPRAAMPMSPPPPPPAAPRPAASTAARPASPAATPKPHDYPRPSVPAPAQPPRMPTAKALDDALMQELSLSLEAESQSIDKKPAGVRQAESSLDEQMNRLLGEISRKK